MSLLTRVDGCILLISGQHALHVFISLRCPIVMLLWWLCLAPSNCHATGSATRVRLIFPPQLLFAHAFFSTSPSLLFSLPLAVDDCSCFYRQSQSYAAQLSNILQMLFLPEDSHASILAVTTYQANAAVSGFNQSLCVSTMMMMLPWSLLPLLLSLSLCVLRSYRLSAVHQNLLHLIVL